MNSIIRCAILATLLTGTVCARAKEINWTDCQNVTKPFEKIVDDYNKKHEKLGDGYAIQMGCTYSNPPATIKPLRKIPISPGEVQHLHELRRAADAALTVQDQYEKFLMKKHFVAVVDSDDPRYLCTPLAYFVYDEDVITVDPNLFPGESCP